MSSPTVGHSEESSYSPPSTVLTRVKNVAKITFVAVGILLTIGAIIAHFQGLSAAATVAFALSGAGLLCSGLIGVAIALCKKSALSTYIHEEVGHNASDIPEAEHNDTDSISLSPSTKKSEEDWMDQEAKEDFDHLSFRKSDVIAGFLSIGNKDGWRFEEGNTSETGLRFVRYMLRKFWDKNPLNSTEYRDIIEASVNSFSPSALKKHGVVSYPRTFFDPTITGWSQHAVSRLVGNVSKEPCQNGPFFEVLINSARDSETEVSCFPFSVCVLENREIGKARWDRLKSLKNLQGIIAQNCFSSSSSTSPSSFMQNYPVQMGQELDPNSLRILKGLEYASYKKMKAQTIGNCWMKQPKRSVLLCFYLQILTQREELSHDRAWHISKRLYSNWKKSTVEEIEKLMTSKGMCLDLIPLVKEKIRQLSPLQNF